ncbi:hypothetical protein OEA41_006880 [Lepraria neglecta]|uniref:Uncharacterized protein n=1 Tax=Lepraria neglecta TaxID=209136 RepID=A0AAD9Z8U3_9LECA|nr:hypothetical protein OEA41_006880 [Lepraria neglecta]
MQPTRIEAIKNTEDGLRRWVSIVETYSKAQLTKSEDKLGSISGLAQRLQRVMKGRYLAGLWEERLIEQLLWYTRPPSLCPKPYQSPTWSWAAISSMVCFSSSQLLRDYDLLVELVDVAVENIGDNPLGQCKSGYLRLRGTVLPVLENWAGESLEVSNLHMLGYGSGHAGFDPGAKEFVRDVIPDVVDDRPSGREVLVPILDDSSYSYGLILYATDTESGQYWRIGYFNVRRWQKVRDQAFFQNEEDWSSFEKTITII